MLYKMVYEQLREQIQNGDYPVDSKLPPVPELCEKFSVSAITIRKALELLKSDGYITRQPRIGTKVKTANPRKPAPSPDLPLIGVIMTDFSDSFGTTMLKSILKSSLGKAHILLGRTMGDNHLKEDQVSAAVTAGAKGMMLVPSSSAFIPKTVLDLIYKRFPVTILDRKFDGIPAANVTSDNLMGAMEATQYLFSLGHSHVAFVSSQSTVSSNDDRRRGWEIAHAKNKIALDEAQWLNSLKSTLPESDAAEQDRDIDRMTDFIEHHPEVTAYLCGEYNIAVLLHEALTEAGKSVPDDISIVCFDHPGKLVEKAMFRFTYVAQDEEKLGEKATNLTLEQIVNGPTVERVEVPCKLVIGSSTKKR